MLEFLVSFVAGAMAEHFQQKRIPLLRTFVLTFTVFTVAFAIGLPLTAPVEARERGLLYVALISAGAGTTLGLLMVAVLRLLKPKHKTNPRSP
ncbi:hypothetical protein LFL97_17000 [Burkholderia sp. JSH-S8]|uniref:hypothetical protein n=1 Tax=Burkholderia stagnalis TaxID=1503054 RepID=UPI000AE45CDE|nr:hypothetical protein [Burkholderia stagnalis]WGS41382.1 hypothetical protein LFL97_17000 [Burkholderia sp. JSH-S8]